MSNVAHKLADTGGNSHGAFEGVLDGTTENKERLVQRRTGQQLQNDGGRMACAVV